MQYTEYGNLDLSETETDLDVDLVTDFNDAKDEATKQGVGTQHTTQADGGAEKCDKLQHNALTPLSSLAPHVELASIYNPTFYSGSSCC